MWNTIVARLGEYSIVCFLAGAALFIWATAEGLTAETKLSGLPVIVLVPAGILAFFAGLGCAVYHRLYHKSRASLVGVISNAGAILVICLLMIGSHVTKWMGWW